MKGIDLQEWQNTIKLRVDIVRNNIIKGQKDPMCEEVQKDGRSLAEMSNDELLEMLMKFTSAESMTSDVKEKMKYKQAKEMTLYEIKRRR